MTRIHPATVLTVFHFVTVCVGFGVSICDGAGAGIAMVLRVMVVVLVSTILPFSFSTVIRSPLTRSISGSNVGGPRAGPQPRPRTMTDARRAQTDPAAGNPLAVMVEWRTADGRIGWGNT